MADAGLVAGDAGADVVQLVVLRFVGHFRVANQGARHAAHVGLAIFNNEVGVLWLVDAPCNQHRYVQCVFEYFGLLGNIARFECHRRRNVYRATQACGCAQSQVHIVQMRLQSLTNGQYLVCIQTAAVEFVSGNAHADDKIIRSGGAYRFQNVHAETQAVFQAATVLVFAQIDLRAHELRRQIAMAGHKLCPIDAGLMQVAGGLYIAF